MPFRPPHLHCTTLALAGSARERNAVQVFDESDGWLVRETRYAGLNNRTMAQPARGFSERTVFVRLGVRFKTLSANLLIGWHWTPDDESSVSKGENPVNRIPFLTQFTGFPLLMSRGI